MKKPYVILDFDGTIANTNDIITESWQATFKNYLGHELPVRDIEATFGETLAYTISVLLPGEDPEEVTNFYRDYQYGHCEGRIYLFPGMRELMENLKARGHKIGVATSRTRGSFGRYIKELEAEQYIDALVAMEDVSRHKPDPESALKVLEKFGAKPSEAIMVGDTKYDIGCANNAGVESVMIQWSHYFDKEAMEAEGFVPTYYVDTPDEILELV